MTMTDRRNIFSERALAKMNEGTRTDYLSDSRSGWIVFFLLALTVGVASIVYWGFFSTMVSTVDGLGITMREDGLGVIRSKGKGVIDYLNIEPGSPIQRGQIVGQVYNPENFFNIKSIEMDYRQLESYVERFNKGYESLTDEKLRLEEFRKERIGLVLDKQKASRDRSSELADIYDQLRGRGSASKIDYYKQLEQMLQNESSITSMLIQAAEFGVTQKDAVWAFHRNKLDLERQMAVKGAELGLAEKIFQDSSWIRSDEDGRIIEMLKNVGDPVVPGDMIALVSSSEQSNIHVVSYVPMDKGKKVKPGMSVYFSPASMDARDYGYIKGVVREVSPYAVSSDSILTELKNREFTAMLSQSGAMVRVVVELLPSRKTPSGWLWTSRKGSPSRLEAGAVGSIQINTSYRNPVSYVIPYLRQIIMGVDSIRPVKQEDSSKQSS